MATTYGNGHNDDGHAAAADSLDASAVMHVVVEEAKRRVRSHPAPTLAAAFGVGLVLGGGVPPFVIRLGGAIAVRMLSQQMMAHMMSSFGDPRQPVDVEARARSDA